MIGAINLLNRDLISEKNVSIQDKIEDVKCQIGKKEKELRRLEKKELDRQVFLEQEKQEKEKQKLAIEYLKLREKTIKDICNLTRPLEVRSRHLIYSTSGEYSDQSTDYHCCVVVGDEAADFICEKLNMLSDFDTSYFRPKYHIVPISTVDKNFVVEFLGFEK